VKCEARGLLRPVRNWAWTRFSWRRNFMRARSACPGVNAGTTEAARLGKPNMYRRGELRTLDCRAGTGLSHLRAVPAQRRGHLAERRAGGLPQCLRRAGQGRRGRAPGPRAHRAVLIVSPNMDQVFRTADRVSLLRCGTRVGIKLLADNSHSEVVAMITGLSS
jgi:hypothetical protein